MNDESGSRAPAAAPTPGPWTVERGNFGVGRYIAGPDGAAICRMASNTTPRTMQRERDGVHEANARLIAAAPELLEALKSASASIEQLVAIGRIPANNKGLRDARAALAKAGAA